jgi:DeoR/GlpR family transcriptional regulator of sugar metabolism
MENFRNSAYLHSIVQLSPYLGDLFVCEMTIRAYLAFLPNPTLIIRRKGGVKEVGDNLWVSRRHRLQRERFEGRYDS